MIVYKLDGSDIYFFLILRVIQMSNIFLLQNAIVACTIL
jgi:hypothetical protein